jgi:hypothetical protein
MKKEGFFSKTYVYPTIWAVIIGLLAFIGGFVWQKISGPDRVVVLNNNQIGNKGNDTTITFIRFQPDENYFKSLFELSQVDLQKNYQSKTNQAATKFNVDSVSAQIAREYQFKFDSLRLSIIKNEITKPIVLGNLIPLYEKPSNVTISRIKKPKFEMPKIVTGYSSIQMNAYAAADINSLVIKRKDKVELTLEFFNKETISEITPVIVNIVQRQSENSLYYIWGEQYEITDKKSMIVFSGDFKPGKYKLEVGFYFLNEINKKFPIFYSNTFDIEIVK